MDWGIVASVVVGLVLTLAGVIGIGALAMGLLFRGLKKKAEATGVPQTSPCAAMMGGPKDSPTGESQAA